MKILCYMDRSFELPEVNSLGGYNNITNCKEDADLSYSERTRNFVWNEYSIMFNGVCPYDFSNVDYSFYYSKERFVPSAFYLPESDLVYINAGNSAFGSESDLQRSVIHETAHAVGFDPLYVGTCFTEGLAMFMENKFCDVNGICYETEGMYNGGYAFASFLVNTVLNTVYKGDEKAFIERTKRGHEEEFLDDMDNYLISVGCEVRARDIVRLSSILFYTERINSCTRNNRINKMRTAMIDCFTGSNHLKNYIGCVDIIDKLLFEYKDSNLSDRTYMMTLDRELGNKLGDNCHYLDDPNNIVETIYRVNNIKTKKEKMKEKKYD